MKKAPNFAPLDVQKLEFSASAYELAIAMQLRILEAESSDQKSRRLYREHKHRMSKIRGLLEDIVHSESVVIDTSIGLELQKEHAWLEETLGSKAALRPTGPTVYFDKAPFYKE